MVKQIQKNSLCMEQPTANAQTFSKSPPWKNAYKPRDLMASELVSPLNRQLRKLKKRNGSASIPNTASRQPIIPADIQLEQLVSKLQERATSMNSTRNDFYTVYNRKTKQSSEMEGLKSMPLNNSGSQPRISTITSKSNYSSAFRPLTKLAKNISRNVETAKPKMMKLESKSARRDNFLNQI